MGNTKRFRRLNNNVPSIHQPIENYIGTAPSPKLAEAIDLVNKSKRRGVMLKLIKLVRIVEYILPICSLFNVPVAPFFTLFESNFSTSWVLIREIVLRFAFLGYSIA